MAGIYLHIPFCRKACSYCDFHFSTKVSGVDDFSDALLMEIQTRSKTWEYGNVQTIYFGGGTPSLLPLARIEKILDTLRKYYPVSAEEVTFEMNPDDASDEYLRGLYQLGINRLSVGFQSLRNSDLEWMGRTHRQEHILTIPEKLQHAGFVNYTVDFIFGMPEMSVQTWLEQLQWAVDCGIPHLSLYALTVEQKTLLQYWINKGLHQPPNEGQQSLHYSEAEVFLESMGYRHYEISNYGKPGYESVHNSNYWRGVPYFGFGPSAHSYTGDHRRWNVSNNALYIKGLLKGESYWDSETLSEKDRFNEALMTGLRSEYGVDLNALIKMAGKVYVDDLLKEIRCHPQSSGFKLYGQKLLLDKAYWFYADGMAADLFRV
jgi:oxygen-independent coproporphyrinogen III oxidase